MKKRIIKLIIYPLIFLLVYGISNDIIILPNDLSNEQLVLNMGLRLAFGTPVMIIGFGIMICIFIVNLSMIFTEPKKEKKEKILFIINLIEVIIYTILIARLIFLFWF